MQILSVRDAVLWATLCQMKIEMTYAQYIELRSSIMQLRSSLLLELEKARYTTILPLDHSVYKKLHDERITEATKALENTLAVKYKFDNEN